MSLPIQFNKKKTDLFLFSFNSNGKEQKMKSTYSKNIFKTAKSGLSLKTMNSSRRKEEEDWQSNQYKNFPDANQKKADKKILRKYGFLSNIKKMRYLTQEVLDSVLDQNEHLGTEVKKDNDKDKDKDKDDDNCNDNRKANKEFKKDKTKQDTTHFNGELTSDDAVVIQQANNCLNQQTMVDRLIVSKEKQKSMFRKMRTMNNSAITNCSSLLKQSSMRYRFSVKMINPEDSIEEYAEKMRPGDTFKTLKKQLIKNLDRMNYLKEDIKQAHNLNQEHLKQYVNSLKRQKTIL